MRHWWRAVGAAAALLALGLPVGAQPGDLRIEGTLRDAAGNPVTGGRVVAQLADGVDVFLGEPSDDDGRYTVSVPAAGSYAIVAVVWPSGRRLTVPAGASIEVGTGAASHDVELSTVIWPNRRKPGTVHRLFLGFVEDPAVVGRGYDELQLDGSSFASADFLTARVTLATQPAALPDVELGLRGGSAAVDFDRHRDGSGPTDLEAWAKLHAWRSADERVDLAVGALVTAPTGDDDLGLGQDALQSKLFVAASHAVRSAALVWQLGLRAARDGHSQGLALDGKLSGSAGLGVVVPFSPKLSLVVEANYGTERFDRAGEESRLLVGVNWKTTEHGLFRGALATGLVDTAPLATSPDSEILVGYALTY